tara:strand:+ start:1531 stop:1782 length:252 start_codon:yes stop_codon:yes gene_type:complete
MKLVDNYIKTVRQIKVLQDAQKKMRAELIETVNAGHKVDGKLGSVLKVVATRLQVDTKKLKEAMGKAYDTFCEEKEVVTLKIV